MIELTLGVTAERVESALSARRRPIEARMPCAAQAGIPARRAEEGNGVGPRFEVGGVLPKKFQRMGSLAGGLTGSGANASGVGSKIDRSPELRGLQRRDGVEFPAFRASGHIRVSGNGVGQREREAMANIEVAVRVFALECVGILRQAGAIAEVPVRAHIIRGVRIGVARSPYSARDSCAHSK